MSDPEFLPESGGSRRSHRSQGRRCLSTEYSAHLDEVGLRRAHARIIRRAVRLAGARGQARVARADRPLLVVVLLATPAEEDRHLNRGTADLHGWRVGIRDKLGRQRHARTQGTLARAVAEHWLVLDISLLVDVQLRLAAQDRGSGDREQRHEEEFLHCRRCWGGLAQGGFCKRFYR